MTTRREPPMDPEVIRRMRSSARYQRWRAVILWNEPLCRECHERKHRGEHLTLEQIREREAGRRRLAEYEK